MERGEATRGKVAALVSGANAIEFKVTIPESQVDSTLDRTTHVRVIGHDTGIFAAPPDRWTVDYVNETDPAE